MAKSTFRKRSTEEEGLPEEEGTEVSDPEESGGRTGGLRRILTIAGIGVILIGGWYLAQALFFAPPPPPPAGPVRPVTPAPLAKAPAPAAPTQEAAPAPPTPVKPPAEGEAKPVPVAPPAKVAVAPPVPGKAGASKAAPVESAVLPAKAEAKPSEKPAPKATPTNYRLQIGSMVMERNAEALKRKLDAAGYPAVIRKGTAYVTKQIVTVGEPTGKREAEDLSRRLNVDGFPSQLLAVGGKYAPQIGAFFTLDEAIDLARELQNKNYPPKITSKLATAVVFQVRHGKFSSRAAAVRRGEELKGKGFSFLVVRE